MTTIVNPYVFATVGGGGDLPTGLPTSGLVGYWDSDHVSVVSVDHITTAADQSGNGNDLTQGTDGNRPQLIANALGTFPAIKNFVGGSRTLSVSSPTGNPGTDVSLCVFLRSNDLGTGSFAAVVTQSNVTRQRILGFGSGGSTIGFLDSQGATTDTNAFYAGDEFDLVLLTAASGNLTAYLADGTGWRQIGTDTETADTGWADEWIVGNQGDWLCAGIWDHALDGTERSDLYTAILEHYFTDIAATDPDNIADLTYWFESDSEVYSDFAGTLPQILDGGSVKMWKNLLASGDDASRNDPAVPTLDQTNTLNSLQVLDFDAASAQFLDVDNAISADTEGMIFAVVKIDTDPPVAGGKTGLVKFGTNTFNYPWTDGIIYSDFGRSAFLTTINPSQSLASWHIYTQHSASGSWALRYNDTLNHRTQTNTVAFTSSPQIGASPSSTPYYLDGKLAALVYFSRRLNLGERIQVTKYLKAKYAL